MRDLLNWMTDVTETMPGGTAANLAHYGLTPLSQPSTLTYANGVSTTYGYDALEGLAAITHSFAAGSSPAAVTFGYHRDADERRMTDTVSNASFLWHPPAAASTPYTPNTLDQYAEIAALDLGYHTDGNLQSDPTGPVGAPAHYTFDWENRLVSTHNGQHVASYSYDALSRRSSTIVDGSATVYVWDGSRIIASYTPGGQELQHYVYGAGSTPILLEVFNGKPLPGQQFWHHTDALGSTVALSNSAGQVSSKQAYSPWGENTTTPATPFLYAGMFHDAETGLYYDNARYYSPTQGRFVSPDPISVKGGINIYAYAANDPVNGTDLSGLDPGGQPPVNIVCEGDCPSGTPTENITVTANPRDPNFSARDLGIGQGGSPGVDSTTTENIVVYGKRRISPNFRPPTNPPAPPLPTQQIPPGYRVRIEPPAPGYPHGYWRLEKPQPQGGYQGFNPSTMKPGPQPDTHVPLPPDFPTPTTQEIIEPTLPEPIIPDILLPP